MHVTKKQLLLGASFIATVPVLGAAGPTLGLVQAASAADWGGSYGGFVAGYGWGHSNQTDAGIPTAGTSGGTGPTGPTGPSGPTGPTADGSYSVDGISLGGTLGYNWQQGLAVFGIEGDYSWASIGGSSDACGAASLMPHACGTELESYGTLRGRIGYAMGATANWLPYVTGGLAVGELHAWDALYPAAGRDFRAGWTVGGGVETTIAPSWTLKVEYLYIDFGSRQMFNIVPGVPETVSFNTNIIRIGFNHKFY